jgi:hypothetical protein
VWEELDGKRSAKEIACLLAERYQREVSVVLPEILAFLIELERRQLVQAVI